MLGVLYQPLQTEVGSTLHQRVCNVSEVVFVLRKLVTLPQRLNEPCTTHIPATPHRALSVLTYWIGHCPQVAVMTGTPALVDAIKVLGGIAAVLCQ